MNLLFIIILASVEIFASSSDLPIKNLRQIFGSNAQFIAQKTDTGEVFYFRMRGRKRESVIQRLKVEGAQEELLLSFNHKTGIEKIIPWRPSSKKSDHDFRIFLGIRNVSQLRLLNRSDPVAKAIEQSLTVIEKNYPK